MSLLDQFQHMLERYIRAEISQSDLLSCVATLKSSRSKNYQINGLTVTVISGSFKNLSPNLNLFVQTSWCDVVCFWVLFACHVCVPTGLYCVLCIAVHCGHNGMSCNAHSSLCAFATACPFVSSHPLRARRLN